MTLATDWDTRNRYLIGAQGNHIAILAPIPHWLSKIQAQSLGVWLSMLAFDSIDDAKEALDRVAST